MSDKFQYFTPSVDMLMWTDQLKDLIEPKLKHFQEENPLDEGTEIWLCDVVFQFSSIQGHHKAIVKVHCNQVGIINNILERYLNNFLDQQDEWKDTYALVEVGFLT